MAFAALLGAITAAAIPVLISAIDPGLGVSEQELARAIESSASNLAGGPIDAPVIRVELVRSFDTTQPTRLILRLGSTWEAGCQIASAAGDWSEQQIPSVLAELRTEIDRYALSSTPPLFRRAIAQQDLASRLKELGCEHSAQDWWHHSGALADALPPGPESRFLHARVLDGIGRPLDAVRSFEQLRDHGPVELQVPAAHAAVLAYQHEFESGQPVSGHSLECRLTDAARRFLELAPDDPDAPWVALETGEILKSRAVYGAARKWFDQALLHAADDEEVRGLALLEGYDSCAEQRRDPDCSKAWLAEHPDVQRHLWHRSQLIR